MQDVYDGQLAPPQDLGVDRGLPDVVPDWVASDPFLDWDLLDSLTCDCCGGPRHEVEPWEPEWTRAANDPAVWATPGVTGLEQMSSPALPSPSRGVQALLDAVARLEQTAPGRLPGAQALVDAQTLLQLEQRLRVHDLERLGDVRARGLTELVGFASMQAWVRRHRPDGDGGDAALASKLRSHPVLSAGVRDGSCSLGAARKVAGALRHCGPFLDGRDGLIDGQPADQVLDAVIAHVASVLCRELGERLWVALRAMATGDPVNSKDTAAWEAARAAGDLDADEVFGPLGQALAAQGMLLPRAKSARLHDAFALLLERFLDVGLGGLMGKAPMQIHVTVPEQTITNGAGAAPARADSGALIPRSVVRRWWHDSKVSVYLLSLGGKALRVVHGQRTLTADERRALLIEGGGRCVGDGCCPARPDPLRPLRPHHVLGFAEDQVTTLEQTVPVCDRLHHDLHTGKRTVQTRDGRWLNENGWTEEPRLEDNPPF
jgi:hypothetical protein